MKLADFDDKHEPSSCHFYEDFLMRWYVIFELDIIINTFKAAKLNYLILKMVLKLHFICIILYLD